MSMSKISESIYLPLIDPDVVLSRVSRESNDAASNVPEVREMDVVFVTEKMASL